MIFRQPASEREMFRHAVLPSHQHFSPRPFLSFVMGP